MAKSDTSAPQESSDLAGQRSLRIQKVEALKKLGINPYPVKSKKEIKNKKIIENFDDYEKKEVTIAGRIMASREHGQLRFIDLEDTSGKVQLYIKKDELQETDPQGEILGWEHLDLLDVGDLIEAQGVVTKTQRGEISILTKSIRILTKAIRPLPTELEDKEDRYRRRYLDMVLHPEIREMFKRRSQFWQEIRNFLNDNGFIEINIPVLEHTTGGADAKPFETHFEALDESLYLRISHELPLKRLLGAGFEKVYDIGPRFRNEGVDDEHLPEHIAMEWYWAYADYRDGMRFTEDMYKYVLKKIYGTLKFNIKGFEVNLEDEWKQIKFVDVIKEQFGIDVFEASLEDMNKIIQEQGAEPEDNISRAADRLWKFIRKDIAGPAFLIDVPKFLSPLSKSDPENPKITQRFHPVIAGSELANAFSELNDPQDQLERFLDQQKMRESGDDEAHMLDIDFVEMLEYGMPPAVGFGLSERVFWFFENVTAKEGVPFPQLRHTIDDTTKKIYPQINFEKIEEKYEKGRENGNAASNRINLDSLKTEDIVEIEDEVLEKFHEINTGYIILEGVEVAKADKKLESLKSKITKKVHSEYNSPSDVKNAENLTGYQEIYKGFGVDPNSNLNSAEALIRRLVQGKDLYNINNVVDTYNLTSAEFEIAMAAYDLDQVQGKIDLRFAKDGEEIIKIMDNEPTKATKGELVYADEKGVICLDYNYRDADRTKITDKTKRIIVFADGNEHISKEYIKKVLSIVGARLEEFTGGKVIAKGYSWKK